uniref:Uncharacterized protein n=1 Tax=Callorhinchus milii TaxID=7868 RepID=A0A4W3GCN2_CALMI
SRGSLGVCVSLSVSLSPSLTPSLSVSLSLTPSHSLSLPLPHSLSLSLPLSSLIFGIITVITGFLGVGAGVEISKCYRRSNPRADPLVCAFGLLSSAPFLYLAVVTAEASNVATYVSDPPTPSPSTPSLPRSLSPSLLPSLPSPPSP